MRDRVLPRCAAAFLAAWPLVASGPAWASDCGQGGDLRRCQSLIGEQVNRYLNKLVSIDEEGNDVIQPGNFSREERLAAYRRAQELIKEAGPAFPSSGIGRMGRDLEAAYKEVQARPDDPLNDVDPGLQTIAGQSLTGSIGANQLIAGAKFFEPLQANRDGNHPIVAQDLNKAAQDVLKPSSGGEPATAPSPLVNDLRTRPRELARTLGSMQGQHRDDPNFWSLLAAALLFSGDKKGAAGAARQAVDRDPQSPLARMVIGHPDTLMAAQAKFGSLRSPFATMDAGQGKSGVTAVYAAGPKARQAAERALAAQAAGIGPGATARTQAQALLQSAVQALALGDSHAALFDVSRALLLDPGNVHARVLRAHISNLAVNHNYQAAILDAGEALELDPKSAAALFEKGYAELQLGQTAQALRDVEDGLALEPNNAMGRFYHGMVLEASGLIAKALDEYAAAERLDPALAPLTRDAIARLKGSRPPPAGRFPRSLPTRPILELLLALTALALLLEGGKRVFYKDWRTTIAPPQPKVATETAPQFSPAGTAPAGRVLGGNFQIVRELGRGGLGIVYEAQDLTLKRRVAIKQLQRAAYAEPGVRERFLKEAQLAAKLRHPNIVQIHSVVNEGELYLVFELVEGQTVSELLSRRLSMTLCDARRVARDVASALDYAHAQKVIHRDLKPANVMDTPGGCKVMDLGIAHEARTGSGATQTAAWGTPPYMAPEQEMGRVCRESDLYALGVMAYEMLTGRRPFDGYGLLERKLNAQFTPATSLAPGLPAAADRFFAKALAPDPAARFKTATELSRALDALDQTPARAPVG